VPIVIEVRRAIVADARELVRLRGVMLAAMSGCEPEPGQWQEAAVQTLCQRLTDPGGPFAAFVVDKPDRPGELAACVVGVIESRLGGPDNPSGETGYVFNVATDPGYRRRGCSRACMEALLGWYQQRGVARVDLRASPQGEALYRALGFAPTSGAAMRLTTPAGQPAGNGTVQTAGPTSRGRSGPVLLSWLPNQCLVTRTGNWAGSAG
jgi:ribosomal protein S18 acetylase RimI-like enzyme